ncbi:expansin EXLX1 family cellulose-binding protein [Streptomyces sp. NPDC059582]|uniref:expansin EXLX1 family cellulose-binding protein n=1 Tax=Streptomyces sp. NPDC059582 TaxID=3346875 RepID=UPI00368583A4
MGAPVALIAACVLVYLVMAFGPDHRADAGPGPAANQPVAGTGAMSPTASRPAPARESPATTSPPATTPSPTGAAAPATAAARPSATDTARTASAVAPLAGRIRPGVTYRGVATSYDAGTGDGACLYGPADDLMVAAMNTADYESAQACGAYVLVRAGGGASVTVRVVNECPSPCVPGQLDLSAQAFAKLADPSLGRVPITWELLSPSTSGTVSIRYKTGSSRWWCGIQALGHRNPVARLEVRTTSGWRQLARTSYNYFISADGAGCGDAIRITDIYGEQLTVDGVALRPDVVQPTRIQFARH